MSKELLVNGGFSIDDPIDCLVGFSKFPGLSYDLSEFFFIRVSLSIKACLRSGVTGGLLTPFFGCSSSGSNASNTFSNYSLSLEFGYFGYFGYLLLIILLFTEEIYWLL